GLPLRRHRGCGGGLRRRLFLRARTESRLPLSPRREHLASVTLKIAECGVTLWKGVAHCSQQHVERRHLRSTKIGTEPYGSSNRSSNGAAWLSACLSDPGDL